jgi:2-succinyl-5-enolpyruvyl-6-hydroxy-3-cyclohexene-1-carboxylate synthase
MADQSTQEFAATFVDELARCGIGAVCLAPGSRSAPLAMAFARHPQVRVYVHLDERCASFFGLGLAKAKGTPVALLCTSGTAAAEFHPAVIEAHHSRTPLLVLTADRPPELREVGANQVIDQARIFGTAVNWSFDPGPPEPPLDGGRSWRRLAARAVAETLRPPPGPVHLNLPFREPLVPPPGITPAPLNGGQPPLKVEPGRLEPNDEAIEGLAVRLRAARRPLLVAGELSPGHRLAPAVDALAKAAGLPILAEPSSQLRREGAVGLVATYDALVRAEGWRDTHQPDLVLQLGASPTSKALRQFLAGSGADILVVDPDYGWRDPNLLATSFWRCDPEALLTRAAQAYIGPASSEWQASWLEGGRRAAAALSEGLLASELFEGHVVRALAQALPEEARVMVGSSMAIRDVDTFWPSARAGQRFLGNRGASGIDGLVSTGLGASALGPPTVLLMGDLSLYHDMNGLWAIGRHQLSPLLVVLDNNGGGIFHFLPQIQHPDVFEELFGTRLGLQLEDVARLYGLPFHLVLDPSQLPAALGASLEGRPAMTCVRFSRAASVQGHLTCQQAVSGALSAERSV